MREHPILFNDAMVRAVLAGTKMQTRRLVKPQPPEDDPVVAVEMFHPTVIDRRGEQQPGPVVFGAYGHEWSRACPYGAPGDRLWVREAWRTEERKSDFVDGIRFRADGAFVPIENTREAADLWVQVHDRRDRWRPSIFLRPEHCRTRLDVTRVRVERVQDISDADIAAEGVTHESVEALVRAASRAERAAARGFCALTDDDSIYLHADPITLWATAWTLINGRESWDANPWCWVVDFRHVEQARSAA